MEFLLGHHHPELALQDVGNLIRFLVKVRRCEASGLQDDLRYGEGARGLIPLHLEDRLRAGHRDHPPAAWLYNDLLGCNSHGSSFLKQGRI